MFRRLLILAPFLLAVSLQAQIVERVHASAVSATANGASTAGIDTSVNNVNLTTVEIVWLTSVTEPTISDSAGNTYTACSAKFNTTAEDAVRIYYKISPAVSATHTFTVTGTGTFPAIFAQSWSGAGATQPDQTTGAATDAGTTLSTGSITPTLNNELVITAIGVNAIRNFTINGGFTERDELSFASGLGYGGSYAFLIQTTATAANPQWANNGTAAAMATAICSLKAGSTGPASWRAMTGVGK